MILQTVNPELAKEWNYEKNGELTPENVVVGSVKKVWWKCKEGHEWQASLNARSRTGCPYCVNRRIVKGYNDLATTNSLLLEEWDFEKNNAEGISPYSISSGSGKKVYWLCKKGHSYLQAICNRSKRVGCPYCAGKKVLQGYNDLTTTNPQLAMEWNYEKNGELTPEKISAGSGKKVWWKCKEGHEWSAIVSNRSKGFGCPVCGGRYANQ